MEKCCPLIWLSSKSYSDDNCEKQECAWWDDKREQCSIKTFLTKNTTTSSIAVKQEPNDIDHYFL